MPLATVARAARTARGRGRARRLRRCGPRRHHAACIASRGASSRTRRTCGACTSRRRCAAAASVDNCSTRQSRRHRGMPGVRQLTLGVNAQNQRGACAVRGARLRALRSRARVFAGGRRAARRDTHGAIPRYPLSAVRRVPGGDWPSAAFATRPRGAAASSTARPAGAKPLHCARSGSSMACVTETLRLARCFAARSLDPARCLPPRRRHAERSAGRRQALRRATASIESLHTVPPGARRRTRAAGQPARRHDTRRLPCCCSRATRACCASAARTACCATISPATSWCARAASSTAQQTFTVLVDCPSDRLERCDDAYRSSAEHAADIGAVDRRAPARLGSRSRSTSPARATARCRRPFLARALDAQIAGAVHTATITDPKPNRNAHGQAMRDFDWSRATVPQLFVHHRDDPVRDVTRYDERRRAPQGRPADHRRGRRQRARRTLLGVHAARLRRPRARHHARDPRLDHHAAGAGGGRRFLGAARRPRAGGAAISHPGPRR